MLKNMWTKVKTMFGSDTSPDVKTKVEDIPLTAVTPQSDEPSKEQVKPHVPPKTLGDVIAQETRVSSPPPAPVKKPRRPRQKKVAPSPEVLAIYQDKKEEPTEKLDTRLDGNVSKPRKSRKPRTPK